MRKTIRLSHSAATSPREAAREFYESVTQPDMTLVMFFCSSEYDLDVLGAEINRLFTGVQVVGCTTAGEIGPSGYLEHSLAGASFSADACTATTGYMDHLQQFEISNGLAFCERLLREHAGGALRAASHDSFAFLLMDGLSVREEVVAQTFQSALGRVSLIGGSAADGLHFGKTYVYVDGSFRTDSAALILVTTPLPFKVFKTQHFVPTSNRLVITKADTAKRMVSEINGMPAAQEYARILGVELGNASPTRFATSPLLVMIDGNHYIRSIQKVNADNSITFFCAIEEGLVLRVARGVNLTDNLEQTFAEIRAEIGAPQVVLSCDCILRRLEIVENGLEDHVARVFQRHSAIGFNTYGEQFRGVHVNQTLSGVAIGAAAGEVQDD